MTDYWLLIIRTLFIQVYLTLRLVTVGSHVLNFLEVKELRS